MSTPKRKLNTRYENISSKNAVKKIGRICSELIDIGQLPTCKEVLEGLNYEKTISQECDTRCRENVVVKLLGIWKRIVPDVPLINRTSIPVKLQRLVKRRNDHDSKRKGHASFEELNNKLFDLSSCNCKNLELNCNDINCETIQKCQKSENKHYRCDPNKCPLTSRIPDNEADYMRDQKNKNGSIGKMRVGSLDIKDSKRIKAKISRSEKQFERVAREKLRKEKDQYEILTEDLDLEVDKIHPDIEFEADPNYLRTIEQNREKYPETIK